MIPGANNQRLVFDPVLESDAGVYTVVHENDFTKALVTTPAFNLSVAPEGSVPVAGFAGLVLLAGALALGGIGTARKRM